MPGRRNPRAKWVLPEVIDPPDHICITIPVPNDRQHIGAFWGALYNLTSAIFWADDTAHTARLVAQVWQKIYDDLAPQSCKPKITIPIEEWEDILSICESLRFQDGKLQGLCCGEWVDITGQGDSSLGGPGQPGGGADQPQPGGDPVCYHGNQGAAFQWLAPTVVNSGDVLTFSNFDGAAWDGVAPLPLPGRWDCPTGKLFFAGTCQDGTEGTIGGDPMPSAPHMSLICQIAGTWYSALSPITVPGGVSDAQVVVQLNDATIGDNQGQYAFDLCVANNQAAAWTHVLNLKLSQEGGVIDTDTGGIRGSWLASTGYKSVGYQSPGGTGPADRYTVLNFHFAFAALTHLTAVAFTHDTTIGNTSGGSTLGEAIGKTVGGVTTTLVSQVPVNGAGRSLGWSGSQSVNGITYGSLVADGGAGSGGGSDTVYTLTISGTGFDPFA